MCQRPLSQLNDVDIIEEIADKRFRRNHITPSAWVNLARRYHEGSVGPPGVLQEGLREVLVGAAA